jgi:hypothetical protein
VQWTFGGGHRGLRNSEPSHTTPISLNSKPPPYYVDGLGRGATCFTTQSDIGPAHTAPDLPDRSAATVGRPPRQGRGRGKPDEDEDAGDDAEDKGYNENQTSLKETMSISLPPLSATRTTRRPTPFGRPSTSAWTHAGRTEGKPG